MIKSVEEVFAVGLNAMKMGRLNSSAYWKGDEVIILNSDSTLLLKFSGLTPFREDEIKFYVKDYDGMNMKMSGAKEVVFHTGNKTYEKKKCCTVPAYSFDELGAILDSQTPKKKKNQVTFSDKLIPMMDESLSHVEVVGEEGGDLVVVQRDIYTGQRLEIREKSKKDLFAKGQKFNLQHKVGLRTRDVESLFLIISTVDFFFVDEDFTWVENAKHNFIGILGNCLYDTLGELNPVQKGGKSPTKAKQGGRRPTKNTKRKGRTAPTPDDTERPKTEEDEENHQKDKKRKRRTTKRR